VGITPAPTVFRCKLCSRVVPPGTPAVRVAVATRAKVYPYRPRANRVVRVDATGKAKEIRVDDPGGVGREAVREATVCPDCGARIGR
jgi:hypothetical protein